MVSSAVLWNVDGGSSRSTFHNIYYLEAPKAIKKTTKKVIEVEEEEEEIEEKKPVKKLLIIITH